jgi:site-specific DNA-methyltransferase (adenine-specific)
MIDKVLFSSANDNWATPQSVFEPLNAEFAFTLDPCCHVHTAKCAKYFTAKDDGLRMSWHGEKVFMNPPYGKSISLWMKKAYEEAQAGATVVCLVPARTDTKWWHEYSMKSNEIRFCKGRIRFIAANDNEVLGEKETATFPSAVVIFRNDIVKKPVLGVLR